MIDFFVYSYQTSPSSHKAEDEEETIMEQDSMDDKKELRIRPLRTSQEHTGDNPVQKIQRSNRQTEKPDKYGHPETMSLDEEMVVAPSTIPVKGFTGIGIFQPKRKTQDDTNA